MRTEGRRERRVLEKEREREKAVKRNVPDMEKNYKNIKLKFCDKSNYL